MKQRFSSLDVKVIAHELSSALTTLRIANIYDLSSRIFLFKCAKPGSRQQLLVDSGFRCHLTSFTRTAASAPSVFVSKLRKYLKSRRISSVAQIGTDRVIEIVFSDGQYRIFLEFFAAGNIVLVDKELTVLALLRQVSEGDEDVDVKLGGTYVLEAKQNFKGIPTLTKERVSEVLQQQVKRTKAATEVGGKKAKRHKGGEDLRKAISAGFSEYPAHLLDHAFRVKGFDALKKPEEVLGDEKTLTKLMVAIKFADEVFRSLGSSDDANGYIIAKLKEDEKFEVGSSINPNRDPPRDSLLYDDFHPFRPAQFENKPGIHIVEIKGFNQTVDEFYSSIESQKLESRLTERELTAKKKLETAKAEHEKRVGALQHVQELHIRKAQAIETNTHRVEEATAALNGLIGQGLDWMDIAKLIENEQGRSNAVAQMVKLPLKLYENTITLLLDEPGAQDDEDDELDEGYDSEDSVSDDDQKKPAAAPRPEKLSIDIDLALSPWANARQYYDQKKTAAVKEQKTIQASSRALKNTEKKIDADLKKGLKQETQTLRPARRKFFFENFLYFISSDGYLVLGGKDANQNEILYRRHLKKGDVYVHADLQGASSVVVKNKLSNLETPIPPGTLSQAGALAVCTSTAWESKAVMAAWWVNAEQVSKTVRGTGQFLTKEGDFAVTGNKNFLPPSQLLLGFGVMWLIDEESRQNHGKLRVLESDSSTVANSGFTGLEENVDAFSMQESDADESEMGGVEFVADSKDDVHGYGSEVDESYNRNTASAQHDLDEDASVASEVDPDEVRSNPLQMSSDVSNLKSANETKDSVRENGKLHEMDHGEDGEDASEDDDNEAELSAPTDGKTSSNSPKSAKGQASKPKSNQVPRGKRSKAARAAKKYADQDEEDRVLAMSLLGSSKQEQAKVDAEAERQTREEKLARDKERRRAQHDRAKRDEEKRAAATTDGVDTSPTVQDQEVLAQEAVDVANLELLVPSLMPTDILIAAIPVVAPWSALSRYKYKAKLQPGSVKKGKAVKEIIGAWSGLATKGGKIIDNDSRDRERVWPGEVAKLKDWRFEEIVGVLPVKGVRVVQSGGSSGASAAAGKGKTGGARVGRGSKKR